MHNFFHFVKHLFCVQRDVFYTAHFPFEWHSLVWHLLIISYFPRHYLWREGNVLKLTTQRLCMILYNFFFPLIWLDFFLFLLSVVFKGRPLLALFSWISKLCGCCYTEVCWWIKPETLQFQICLGMIVLLQPGDVLSALEVCLAVLQ